jgi:hypothetical protein
MSEAETRALIEQLRRSNRRWRRLALGLLAALGVAVPPLTTSTVVSWLRAAEATRRTEAAEELAEENLQEALRQAEQAKKNQEDARCALNQANMLLARQERERRP